MMDGEALSNDDLDVSVSDDELVVRATIDRPEKRNALNDAVMFGLIDVLEAADESPARVVVIRGAEGTFCSGGDLTGFPIGQGVVAYRENFGSLATLIDAMQSTSALTIAAVEGYCLAGGLGVASACEFVLASEDATFGTPEVDVGLFPAQAMAPITRAASEKAALKLLFTGEKIGAEAAREMGLVTDLSSPDSFDDDLDTLVDTLAANSPALIADRQGGLLRAAGHGVFLGAVLPQGDSHPDRDERGHRGGHQRLPDRQRAGMAGAVTWRSSTHSRNR
ncbi:MAG: enoyl-CoA hydratase/isomerase family protein [Natrialbaceae archaeon]|nr:enoyl-CoA hydratase/isomerase family protein [Natrialbaceae archaeon]